MNEHRAISRKDAVIIGSRVLAVLLTIWVFGDISSLPTTVYAFLRYAQQGEHHLEIRIGTTTI